MIYYYIITDNIFIVTDDPVTISVTNISKNSATLQWNLSDQKKDKLKSIRVRNYITKNVNLI